MKAALHRSPPNALASIIILAISVETFPGPSTLVELRVTMAFADLACWKPIIVMSINIGCIDVEGPSASFDFIGTQFILTSISFSTHLLELLRNICVPKQLSDPVVDNLIALMGVGEAIIIVALTPKTPEEVRLLEEPVRLANVLISQFAISIGWDLRYICIDRQATIRRKSSTIQEHHDLRFPNALGSSSASFLQLALKPCCIFFFQHRYP